MKIMFVCTGNTCRSAMAHHMLEKMVEDKKDIEVYSCGIYADSGEPSTYNAIEIMKEVAKEISTMSSGSEGNPYSVLKVI